MYSKNLGKQTQNKKSSKSIKSNSSEQLYGAELLVNNSKTIETKQNGYKNNISLNFSKKNKKEKEKDNFKDINNFMPKTNIFSKFK